MHSTGFLSLLFISLVLLATFSSPVQAASPHKSCAKKVYRTISTLCSQQGDPEYLRKVAERCCVENCSLTEMMSYCQDSVKASREETF